MYPVKLVNVLNNYIIIAYEIKIVNIVEVFRISAGYPLPRIIRGQFYYPSIRRIVQCKPG